MARLLLIEDEASLVLSLSDRLKAEGHEIEVCTEGPPGEAAARNGDFELIILDLALPGKNGLDICRDLRRDGLNTPILMLTARDTVADKVVGLKLGADDYLTKPFDAAELGARVEALLRRAPGAAAGAPQRRFGQVEVDFDAAVVRRGGEDVHLSALEMRLLQYLVDHPNRVVSRDELLDKVWGYGAMPVTRTVDVHVGGLRQKLEADPSHPRHFLTVHGRGYKFVPD